MGCSFTWGFPILPGLNVVQYVELYDIDKFCMVVLTYLEGFRNELDMQWSYEESFIEIVGSIQIHNCLGDKDRIRIE